MSNKCPKCNTDNPDTQKFCGECATPLQPPEDIDVTETIEAPKEELTRGTTFAGRYEIIEELGKGGMGRVYRVEDTKLEQEVALKLIKPEIAKDKKTIERFRNELKLARNIRHKNVCGMFDLGETEDAHFITMEYVRGEDLRSLIRRIGQLPIGKSISIAKQVCEGLVEAHRLGVVHRDLKSNNIMIDKEGNVRIMDFGIARSLEAKGITGAGVMIGTPEYMSPEQVEGTEVDQRSDIYSLGVILYEMVTGRVPFEGDTPFTIGMKHKGEIPKNPKELNTQISDDLNRLILRCLEKEKDKRHQSAREIRSELENIEKGIPTTERVTLKEKPITSKEITVTFGLKKLFIPALFIAALVAIALIIWRPWSQKEAAPVLSDKPSIAVLPFVDLSQKKDHGYFCDGMTEAIIEKLSQLTGLRVSSRTSVMGYKNTDKSIKKISEELNVTNILEGSIQKEEDIIRVHAQLINVKDNSPIWSDHYDRKLTSIFAIQSDIALQITRVLNTKLSPGEEAQISKKPTENLTAYDFYLRGRDYYYRYQKQDNELAIELFKKALENDPKFALAHAGLGDSFVQRVTKFGFPRKWLDEAIEQSQKAISLEPELSEGYKALGVAYDTKGWHQEGRKASHKAVEYNPNYDTAVGNLGWSYYYVGELDKAMQWFKKNLVLAPSQAYPYYQIGVGYYLLGDLLKAEQWLKKALELQPDLWVVRTWLNSIYLAQDKNQLAFEQCEALLSTLSDNTRVLHSVALVELFSGNYEKAQEYYQKSYDISSSKTSMLGLAYLYWKDGQQDKAMKLFNQCLVYYHNELEQGRESWSIRLSLAKIHAIRDNKEEAYKWLEQSIAAGWRFYLIGLRDPLFENLQQDEQFKRLMEKVKAMVDEMRIRAEVNQ